MSYIKKTLFFALALLSIAVHASEDELGFYDVNFPMVIGYYAVDGEGITVNAAFQQQSIIPKVLLFESLGGGLGSNPFLILQGEVGLILNTRLAPFVSYRKNFLAGIGYDSFTPGAISGHIYGYTAGIRYQSYATSGTFFSLYTRTDKYASNSDIVRNTFGIQYGYILNAQW